MEYKNVSLNVLNAEAAIAEQQKQLDFLYRYRAQGFKTVEEVIVSLEAAQEEILQERERMLQGR